MTTGVSLFGRMRDETLRLGIVVDWLPTARPARKVWPEHLYAHLANSAREHGCVVFLFHLLSVDWQGGRVAGWVRTTSKSPWEKRVLPFPHAVYNRISRRDVEASPACRRALERLGTRAALFNPRFLNKEEVQLALADSPVAGHVPPAVVTRDPTRALSQIREYGDAFLKPVRGALGNGIVRVERRGRLFVVSVNPPLSAKDPTPLKKSLALPQLQRALARMCRKEALLIQRAVPRCRWRGRPVDVRSLVQKEADGTWRLTGAAGRAAAPGGMTTHTLRGGCRIPYDRLADETGVSPPSWTELESICRGAARAVEAACGGGFFEFSIDLAIAQDGRPFLLEVNAKPFPFDEAEIRQRAAKRLFAFARAQATDRAQAARRARDEAHSNKMAAFHIPSR